MLALCADMIEAIEESLDDSKSAVSKEYRLTNATVGYGGTSTLHARGIVRTSRDNWVFRPNDNR